MSSALEYTGESGGLNEAFADMFGKVVETHIAGKEKPIDWKIGDDIFKTVIIVMGLISAKNYLSFRCSHSSKAVHGYYQAYLRAWTITYMCVKLLRL